LVFALFAAVIAAPLFLCGWLFGRRGVLYASAGEAIILLGFIRYWRQLPLPKHDVSQAFEAQLRADLPPATAAILAVATVAAWWWSKST
jgi:hypothetical protein